MVDFMSWNMHARPAGFSDDAVADMPRACRPRDAAALAATMIGLLVIALAGERAAGLLLRVATTLLPVALIAGLIAFAAFRVQFGTMRNRTRAG